jgi:predicted TIM-barrel fold metal-dependent hydrolase
MRYQLTDQDRHIKTIAIEEHFSTPMQTQKSKKTEFRSFYLSSRSEHIGHSIVDQLADLDEQRLAYMNAAGIDIQVLSFTSPGSQAFDADEAIPLAKDANERLHEAVKQHPDRFAGFAALPKAAPDAAADELEDAVTKLGFKGAMIHGHTLGSFLDEKKYWSFSNVLRLLECRSTFIRPSLIPTPSKLTSQATRSWPARRGGSALIPAAISCA